MGVRGGGREIAGCGGGGQRCSRVGEGTAYAGGCVCACVCVCGEVREQHTLGGVCVERRGDSTRWGVCVCVCGETQPGFQASRRVLSSLCRLLVPGVCWCQGCYPTSTPKLGHPSARARGGPGHQIKTLSGSNDPQST